ncbi:MAG: acetate/propionate family kinase [Clostridiales bacterium]|nr:acetate/propionate family kinase [Clostridiales bacterium]
MGFNVLVLNIGSTSFKFKYYDVEKENIVAQGKITNIRLDCKYSFKTGEKLVEGEINDSDGYRSCLKKILDFINEYCGGFDNIKAIGFKTVMAGKINYPCILDSNVLDEMRKYNFIAPAHNIPYIEAIETMQKLTPDIPLIGSFETGFHKTIPEYAYIYSIDKNVADEYSIRKYGFHGAAHSFVAHKFSEVEPYAKKIISIHLGGSSSLCAIKDGCSVDTSMGFSPQSGLPMNDRTGDIDVFAILYLMEQKGMSPTDMREFLSSKCGLLGMSGISSDMQKIVESNEAETVIDAYAYAVAKFIGSYIPVLGGLDLISFSGGIGENSFLIKQKICKYFDYMGIKLDCSKQDAKIKSGTLKISSDDSTVKVYTTVVDEELMVAKNAYKVVKGE